MVATLSRALTQRKGKAVSRALDQESIAQHQVGGQGDCLGLRPRSGDRLTLISSLDMTAGNSLNAEGLLRRASETHRSQWHLGPHDR